MARKVLFYTHAFGGGGAEIVFSRLAAAFADAGDDVIFAADHPGPSTVHDRPNLRHVLIGKAHWTAVRRLAALLRDETPDTSFSALGAQNLKHVVAALMAGRRNRCVLGYHGYAESETRPLSSLSFRATPVLTRLSARTICVSDALLEDVRSTWRASRRRTLRIYNPVSLPSGQHPRDRPSGAPPLVIGCGRLVPGKRFVDLVAALAQVEPMTTRLAILGEGPERAAIEAAVRLYGLAGRVELPGHVEDMSAWYARADCLAISSQSESFGLTAAEALAQGTPVVSTACGGPVEILDQGLYGHIVPVGDVAALATALTTALATPGAAEPRKMRGAMFATAEIHRSYAELIDALP